jgi:hypothetical protein
MGLGPSYEPDCKKCGENKVTFVYKEYIHELNNNECDIKEIDDWMSTTSFLYIMVKYLIGLV